FILPYIEQDSLYKQISQAPGAYTDPGKNTPYGLTRVESYLCPSALTDREVTTAPHNVTPTEFIPPNTGEGPYTTHYYAINGPPARSRTPASNTPSSCSPTGRRPPTKACPWPRRGCS